MMRGVAGHGVRVVKGVQAGRSVATRVGRSVAKGVQAAAWLKGCRPQRACGGDHGSE